MKWIVSWGCMLSCLMAGCPAWAEGPIVLPVWPGATVGDSGTFGPERVRTPADAPSRDAKWITSVTKPTISVFRPDRRKNTRTAMIVCPGGGYWNLAIDKEGDEVAAWLVENGMTGIVLKYRVPRRPGQPEPLPAPGPLLDAQRAVSLVRSKANEWGIGPNRIGIIGFSAGGHLAVATATNFDKRAYEPIDEVDNISCRPDFAAAIYPGYLVARNRDTMELASYIRIPMATPPIFLVHAQDDPEPSPEHSLAMFLALKRARVPAELHIYTTGGHSFGVRRSAEPATTWTDRCLAWLQNQGFLRK